MIRICEKFVVSRLVLQRAEKALNHSVVIRYSGMSLAPNSTGGLELLAMRLARVLRPLLAVTVMSQPARRAPLQGAMESAEEVIPCACVNARLTLPL